MRWPLINLHYTPELAYIVGHIMDNFILCWGLQLKPYPSVKMQKKRFIPRISHNVCEIRIRFEFAFGINIRIPAEHFQRNLNAWKLQISSRFWL